jgi:hypothetical protein
MQRLADSLSPQTKKNKKLKKTHLNLEFYTATSLSGISVEEGVTRRKIVKTGLARRVSLVFLLRIENIILVNTVWCRV